MKNGEGTNLKILNLQGSLDNADEALFDFKRRHEVVIGVRNRKLITKNYY